MTDWDAVIREYLAGLTNVSAVLGARVYSGSYLPPGYSPASGPALLFSPRGGGQDFSSHVLSPSIQMRVYAETEAAARAAARAIYDCANDTKSRKIIYARMEDGTFPQLLREPGSDWPYILMFFKFHIQN